MSISNLKFDFTRGFDYGLASSSMQPAPSEKTTRCDGIVARFTLDLETHLMWTQTAGNPQTEEGLIND